jgi:hypothetical protein
VRGNLDLNLTLRTIAFRLDSMTRARVAQDVPDGFRCEAERVFWHADGDR